MNQPSPGNGYPPNYPPPKYTDQPCVALEQSVTNPSIVRIFKNILFMFFTVHIFNEIVKKLWR